MKFRCNHCASSNPFMVDAIDQDEGFRRIAQHMNDDHSILGGITSDVLEIQDVSLNIKLRSVRS
jgi:predicted small metal-binding protein